MQRKLLFFINPVSGARSKHLLESQITRRCLTEKAQFELSDTCKSGEYHFLPQKIEQEGFTDVVICGGDGSISPIVRHLLEVNVHVGIIPLGSGNGLARTAGIPYNIEKALSILFTGTPQPVDAFYINDRLGCQIAGLGYDAFVAAEFAKERKRGLSTYTRLAVKHFFSAKPYRFSISAGGQQFELSAFILCVSNANQFGNNLKIAPKARLSDGLLDVVVLKKTSKAQILLSFAHHLLFPKKTGRPNSSKERILYFTTDEIEIINYDQAPVHIDGDPAETLERYKVRIVPAAYRLIHPA